jgi:hypothetical protein
MNFIGQEKAICSQKQCLHHPQLHGAASVDSENLAESFVSIIAA